MTERYDLSLSIVSSSRVFAIVTTHVEVCDANCAIFVTADLEMVVMFSCRLKKWNKFSIK